MHLFVLIEFVEQFTMHGMDNMQIRYLYYISTLHIQCAVVI